jgi:hypothetical protein
VPLINAPGVRKILWLLMTAFHFNASLEEQVALLEQSKIHILLYVESAVSFVKYVQIYKLALPASQDILSQINIVTLQEAVLRDFLIMVMDAHNALLDALLVYQTQNVTIVLLECI